MKNQNNKANANKHKRQPQDTNKKQLERYLKTLSKFPNVIEHKKIANSFNVSNYRRIFKQDAIRRLLEKTAIEPKTASTLEVETGVNQKYICCIKGFCCFGNLH